jgi:hypothetical protein
MYRFQSRNTMGIDRSSARDMMSLVLMPSREPAWTCVDVDVDMGGVCIGVMGGWDQRFVSTPLIDRKFD